MTIPFDAIYENEDRSWSARLVQYLSSNPPETDLLEVWETLEKLADPRTYSPLTNLMENSEKSEGIRDIASRILSSCSVSEQREKRQAWWQSGDHILMTHAIRTAAHNDGPLLLQVAQQPEHEVYEAAIQRLGRGFDELNFQQFHGSGARHYQRVDGGQPKGNAR